MGIAAAFEDFINHALEAAVPQACGDHLFEKPLTQELEQAASPMLALPFLFRVAGLTELPELVKCLTNLGHALPGGGHCS